MGIGGNTSEHAGGDANGLVLITGASTRPTTNKIPKRRVRMKLVNAPAVNLNSPSPAQIQAAREWLIHHIAAAAVQALRRDDEARTN